MLRICLFAESGQGDRQVESHDLEQRQRCTFGYLPQVTKRGRLTVSNALADLDSLALIRRWATLLKHEPVDLASTVRGPCGVHANRAVSALRHVTSSSSLS